MFSAQVSHGRSLESWKTKPIFEEKRFIFPTKSLSKEETIFKKVVFPQPDGPIIDEFRNLNF